MDYFLDVVITDAFYFQISRFVDKGSNNEFIGENNGFRHSVSRSREYKEIMGK